MAAILNRLPLASLNSRSRNPWELTVIWVQRYGDPEHNQSASGVDTPPTGQLSQAQTQSVVLNRWKCTRNDVYPPSYRTQMNNRGADARGSGRCDRLVHLLFICISVP